LFLNSDKKNIEYDCGSFDKHLIKIDIDYKHF